MFSVCWLRIRSWFGTQRHWCEECSPARKEVHKRLCSSDVFCIIFFVDLICFFVFVVVVGFVRLKFNDVFLLDLFEVVG